MSPLAQRLAEETNWTAVEEGLCRIENGIAVLYGLADGSLEGTGLDPQSMGRALYFVARGLNEELKAVERTVGLKE